VGPRNTEWGCSLPGRLKVQVATPRETDGRSHEVLLSDALRPTREAATADVQVTLAVVPGVPHVFQGFAAALDEGDAALDRAANFLKDQLAAVLPIAAA
jgi:hypothetical protein